MIEACDWRDAFPVTRDWGYFDIANKAPIPLAVKLAWHKFLNEAHETPGDKSRWKECAEELRVKIGAFIGAESPEIAFVKNTSEGLNVIAQSFPWSEGDHVVIHGKEHPNNLYPWLHLRRRQVKVQVINSDAPLIDQDNLISKIGPSTKMVVISAVSYCTGQKFDLKKISKCCHQHGALLVVDAIQALGVIPFAVKQLGVDALVSGPQKGLLCTHGLGFLYCKATLIKKLLPPFAARSSVMEKAPSHKNLSFLEDARRFEHGNLNYGGVYALSAALDFINEVGPTRIYNEVSEIISFLIGSLEQRGLVSLTPVEAGNHAGIVVIRSKNTEKIVTELKDRNFLVTGVADGIRVSPHFYNTKVEIENLVDAIVWAVKR